VIIHHIVSSRVELYILNRLLLMSILLLAWWINRFRLLFVVVFICLIRMKNIFFHKWKIKMLLLFLILISSWIHLCLRELLFRPNNLFCDAVIWNRRNLSYFRNFILKLKSWLDISFVLLANPIRAQLLFCYSLQSYVFVFVCGLLGFELFTKV